MVHHGIQQEMWQEHGHLELPLNHHGYLSNEVGGSNPKKCALERLEVVLSIARLSDVTVSCMIVMSDVMS